MRYYRDMLKIAEEFTSYGLIVLMPFVALPATMDNTQTKRMLDAMHRQKIDMAEQVYVIGNHIGVSTCGEIRYALNTGKEVWHITDMNGRTMQRINVGEWNVHDCKDHRGDAQLQ